MLSTLYDPVSRSASDRAASDSARDTRNSNVSSSNVSSTPTTVEHSAPSTVLSSQSEGGKPGMTPWTPLALSFDGGGVRGLSSLYVLRRIMLRVRQLEAEDSQTEEKGQTTQDSHRLPLPCHYFDHIVGTSTGGLIAVMLGRLRMDVNECIQQYLMICNAIFRPHRYIGYYSDQALKTAIEDVIRRYCKCHGPSCTNPQKDLMRQYDCLEPEGIVTTEQACRINHTCKTIVITQRRAHGKNEFDNCHLLRSYNHQRRLVHSPPSCNVNLGRVDETPLRIWEACRATSAAPLYFKKILIDGSWYIDGGVGDNNPSTHAWNEAGLFNFVHTGERNVAVLVSIGTGLSEPKTKFGGLLSLFKYARTTITDTENAHEATRNLAHHLGAHYFRFNVRPIRDLHDGLSKTKLDECKKKRRRRRNRSAPEPQQPPVQHELESDPNHDGSSSATAWEHKTERALADMDVKNDKEATQDNKGGYKPAKYDYTTYRTIKKLTDRYCLSEQYPFLREHSHQEAQNVKREIEDCARLLVDYSRRRKADDAERWQRFRRHPDSNHEANKMVPPGEA